MSLTAIISIVYDHYHYHYRYIHYLPSPGRHIVKLCLHPAQQQQCLATEESLWVALLLPHPPSDLKLQSSPPLRLSLPSHLVTSRTPSQPYWFTWPPCSCCHVLRIDFLTPGQPHWFTWCCGVISTSILPLCFLILPPLFLILLLVLVLGLSHALATQLPSHCPFLDTPFPHIPHMHLWTFFLDSSH